MNYSRWGLVLLAVGFVAGLFVGTGVLAPNADAQVVPAGLTPQRFQISAWGMASANPAGQGERGCYIMDTATGELWHAAADEKPKKISDKLRQ